MADGARAERLGEIIRRQRELGELSMRQFATLAGISNPYLSQIERGLREPSDRVLDAIASPGHRGIVVNDVASPVNFRAKCTRCATSN